MLWLRAQTIIRPIWVPIKECLSSTTIQRTMQHFVLMTFVTSGMSLAGSRHLPVFYFLKQPDVAQSRTSEYSAEES